MTAIDIAQERRRPAHSPLVSGGHTCRISGPVDEVFPVQSCIAILRAEAPILNFEWPVVSRNGYPDTVRQAETTTRMDSGGSD